MGMVIIGGDTAIITIMDIIIIIIMGIIITDIIIMGKSVESS